jgi:DNA modification methylase
MEKQKIGIRSQVALPRTLVGHRVTKIAQSSAVSLEPLHRFHPYCARFPSQVAERAIAAYSEPGDSVLDPFCGSGTSLVAGLAHGRSVVGSDIDILAGMLTEVKCGARSANDYRRWQRTLSAKLAKVFVDIERHWSRGVASRPGGNLSFGSLALRLPEFPELNYWFPPQVSAALAGIAEAAHECRDAHYEKVALVSLSASIIAKWPNTLSYAMDIDHTRPHRRVQRFRLGRVLEVYQARLERTITCLSSLQAVYDQAGVAGKLVDFARIYCPHDARRTLFAVPDASQALVVTSPPYFNAVDYPRAHRMSVCWMNGHAPADLASRSNYVGLHRASRFNYNEWLAAHPAVRKLIPQSIIDTGSLGRSLAGFFADLEKVLQEIWRVLRPGGHAVLVIGDNVIKGQRIASHRALVELGEALGFHTRRTDPREIVTLRRRYPVGPFGFDGPMTHEFVVVLQKPRARLRSTKTNLHGQIR